MNKIYIILSQSNTILARIVQLYTRKNTVMQLLRWMTPLTKSIPLAGGIHGLCCLQVL